MKEANDCKIDVNHLRNFFASKSFPANCRCCERQYVRNHKISVGYSKIALPLTPFIGFLLFLNVFVIWSIAIVLALWVVAPVVYLAEIVYFELTIFSDSERLEDTKRRNQSGIFVLVLIVGFVLYAVVDLV